MTTNGVGGNRMRSPIHGPAQTIATPAGVTQAERVAVHALNTVSEQDLDKFLQARAKKAEGQKKNGLFAALLRPFQKSTSSVDAARAVKHELTSSIRDLAQVYRDGVVSEHELGLIGGAQKRLKDVQRLADPDVLLMLPKGVRERLETQLFEPLAMVEAAASRRQHRVWDAITARDLPALVERLSAPAEHRTLDVDVLVRSSIDATSLVRYVPGDLVCVPRSDGTFQRGVVTSNNGAMLGVEMLTGNGALAKKDLSADVVAAANPLKIGDRFTVGDKTVWASSVDERGMIGYVDEPGKERRAVRSDELAALFEQALAPRLGQTRVGSALAGVPGYLRCSVDDRRALEALLSLKSDPVFDKAANALRALIRDPRFMQQPAHKQADELASLLRDRGKLHAVTPNFGAERVNHASVVQGSTVWGDASLFATKGPAPRAIATEITLTVGDAVKKFDVVMAETMTQAERNRTFAELTETLQKLPPETVASLRSIVINPEKNPSDDYFAKKFNMPNFVSAMTAHGDTRQITVYAGQSVTSALQSFCHEAGHLVSIDVFGSIDASTPKWQTWRNAVGADAVAVSKYAMNNEQEDFAETFSLYTSTKGTARHDAYRAMMPHRFAILDEIAREAAR